jgi:DNA-binding PadR family transcriptional regulator
VRHSDHPRSIESTSRFKQTLDPRDRIFVIDYVATVNSIDPTLDPGDKPRLRVQHPGDRILHQVFRLFAVGERHVVQSRFEDPNHHGFATFCSLSVDGMTVENFVANETPVWDNYVMRTTRNVASYSDPPLLVLVSLISGPKHGHAMIDDIVELCGTRLGPGTLYGAIARLESQGWIEPLPADERRYPYRLTPEGLKVVRAKLATLNQFTKAGLRRLEAL